MERYTGLLGLAVIIGLAWLMSSYKRSLPWRVICGGLSLQFIFALLILKTPLGQYFFATLGNFFQAIITCTDAGAAFLFDLHERPGDDPLPPNYTLWRCFAFGVLPTIVLFSSLMEILYYIGVMQKIVRFFSWLMQKTLGTSGAETLSIAANIFVGQTEAPLVVRPYVKGMTISELNVVMVGGFATIAGGVLAIFVRIGIDAGHLITASVISAPAALVIAKVMQPETEHPQTTGHVEVAVESRYVNILEATAEGAARGMKLAINVAAMLIAFVALVALVDLCLGGLGCLLGFEGDASWSLNKIFGVLFAPFAWLIGIPWPECSTAGSLLGTKMVVNEVLAYYQLTNSVRADLLSPRSHEIMTYALCGFANFSSIGIQLGGIGGIAPERKSDLARLGLRAMLGGTLAALMTACVASLLL
ncbi:MAG: NupC/NupG family nucleoside CNT transporter [Pirellulales bacterium]|nr:NupC/NupG family nucleoside CNT transporter [Pirellulales bacterium]